MNPFELLPSELAWVITTYLDWRMLNVVLKVDRRLREASLKEAKARKLELEDNSKTEILPFVWPSAWRKSFFESFCDRYGPLGERIVVWSGYLDLDMIEMAYTRGGHIFRRYQKEICWVAMESKRFSILESGAIDRTVRIQPLGNFSYETMSPLYYAVAESEYTAADYRRLLEAGYRPSDLPDAFVLAVEMLWKGWSVDLNMPKDVFGLEGIDRGSLSVECHAICRVLPSIRIRVLKGLATLGADIDAMEGVANGYMGREEKKKLRSAFDEVRSGGERKRKRGSVV